jgi:hypothetical protein
MGWPSAATPQLYTRGSRNIFLGTRDQVQLFLAHFRSLQTLFSNSVAAGEQRLLFDIRSLNERLAPRLNQSWTFWREAIYPPLDEDV